MTANIETNAVRLISRRFCISTDDLWSKPISADVIRVEETTNGTAWMVSFSDGKAGVVEL